MWIWLRKQKQIGKNKNKMKIVHWQIVLLTIIETMKSTDKLTTCKKAFYPPTIKCLLHLLHAITITRLEMMSLLPW